MAVSAGARLKTLRTLIGLSRDKFTELVGIENLRLITIENDRGRMSTDDLALVSEVFPEVIYWLLNGKPVTVETLEKSGNLYLQRLALTLKLEGKTELEGEK